MADTEQSDLTTLTVTLLSAYFSNNTVESAELAGLIRSTHAALSTIDAPAPAKPVEPAYTPAVSVRKSLASSDHLISLIDGKPYKTLKRHLASHGLTPAEYRTRYDLPSSYPLVAKAYSDARRAVAERTGLGRLLIKPTVEAETAPDGPVTPAASPATPRKTAKAAAATSTETKPAPRKATAARRTSPAAHAETVAADVPVMTKSAPRKARAATKAGATAIAPTAPAEPPAVVAPKAKAKPSPAKTTKRKTAKPLSVAESEAETPPAAEPKPRVRKTLKIVTG